MEVTTVLDCFSAALLCLWKAPFYNTHTMSIVCSVLVLQKYSCSVVFHRLADWSTWNICVYNPNGAVPRGRTLVCSTPPCLRQDFAGWVAAAAARHRRVARRPVRCVAFDPSPVESSSRGVLCPRLAPRHVAWWVGCRRCLA